MNAQMGLLALAVLTIIFNAGGFLWMTKNHLKHVQQSLDRLEERARWMEDCMAKVAWSLNLELPPRPDQK